MIEAEFIKVRNETVAAVVFLQNRGMTVGELRE